MELLWQQAVVAAAGAGVYVWVPPFFQQAFNSSYPKIALHLWNPSLNLNVGYCTPPNLVCFSSGYGFKDSGQPCSSWIIGVFPKLGISTTAHFRPQQNLQLSPYTLGNEDDTFNCLRQMCVVTYGRPLDLEPASPRMLSQTVSSLAVFVYM